MTSKRIAQNNQQQKSEKAEGNSILRRATVRSDLDAGVQFEELETQPLNNSAFSKDFSQVPISSAVPQPIQTKLTIGSVGDKYEQEADQVAAEVVQQINAPVSTWSSTDEPLQREEMETKDNEAKLMRAPILQRKPSDGGMAATPDLEVSINQARGGGRPMTDNIRRPMEKAFGADFSGVKIHTDAQANQLNQSIQAKAFTTGQDVFFRRGQYEPTGRVGQELLAHELTHVVQQTGGFSRGADRIMRMDAPAQDNPPPQNNTLPPFLYHATPCHIALDHIFTGGLVPRSGEVEDRYLCMSSDIKGATTKTRSASDIIFRVRPPAGMTWTSEGAGQSEWRGRGETIAVSQLMYRRFRKYPNDNTSTQWRQVDLNNIPQWVTIGAGPSRRAAEAEARKKATVNKRLGGGK